MSYRPRFHAAIVVLVSTLSASCSLEVDLQDGNFSCSTIDDRCPSGLVCVDRHCVLPGAGVVDAGPAERDADPVDPVIDGSPGPTIDAGVDAAVEPAVCLADDVISDPATGHCYGLVRNSLTWAEAKIGCQALGMRLAIITSAEEQAVVEQIVSGSDVALAWIGGSDQATEGTWLWVDNSVFSYTNWNDGEPNDYGSGEDCAAIRFSLAGKWDDRACDSSLYILCEKEP